MLDYCSIYEVLGMFRKAQKYHSEGKLTAAKSIYYRCIDDGVSLEGVGMNLASILKNEGNYDEALKVVNQALESYPDSPGLRNNKGNILYTLGDYEKAVIEYRIALVNNCYMLDSRISLGRCLVNMGYETLATTIFLQGLTLHEKKERTKLYGLVCEVLLNTEELCARYRGLFEMAIRNVEVNSMGEESSKEGNNDVIGDLMFLSIVHAKMGNLIKSQRYYQKTLRNLGKKCNYDYRLLKKAFVERWHSHCWNLGILHLKGGNIKLGWHLYDHGLHVKAEGKQKWQRATIKSFTSTELRIYSSRLKSKVDRILIMGEQAIGDTLMFSMLVDRFAHHINANHITIAPGDRLVKTFRSSFPSWTILTDKELLSADIHDFDCQIPIGSLPQHGFKTWRDITTAGRKIFPSNSSLEKTLRSEYKELAKGKKIVGISWQGGGKPERVKLKSIGLKMLMREIYEDEKFMFVSLQYGDDKEHLERLKRDYGICILHDDRIDPMRRFDEWLSQVAAMDAVVSIANTTVHGAGSQNIPTACLVSRSADWRWLNREVCRDSYWYKSVKGFHQDSGGGWQEALQQCKRWLGSL